VFGVGAIVFAGKLALLLEKKVFCRYTRSNSVGVNCDGFLPTITKDPARLQVVL
jgi:hypothetical protein